MRRTGRLLGALVVLWSLIATPSAQAPTPAPAGGAQQAKTPTGGRRGGGRGGFVTPVYASVPPEIPATVKGSHAVLIFSKTNGYREEPAIQASNDALVAIAK